MSGRMTQNYFYNILSICILMTAKENKIELQTSIIRWHVWALLLLVYLQGPPFTSLICGKRAYEHMLASSQRAGAAWGSVWCHSTCHYCTAADRVKHLQFHSQGSFCWLSLSHMICVTSTEQKTHQLYGCAMKYCSRLITNRMVCRLKYRLCVIISV